MAKKANFAAELENEIKEKPEDTSEVCEVTEPQTSANETKFVLSKKKVQKANKKTFPLYMEQDLAKKLDKVCNQTGYARNELINKMIEFCLENLELN